MNGFPIDSRPNFENYEESLPLYSRFTFFSPAGERSDSDFVSQLKQLISPYKLRLQVNRSISGEDFIILIGVWLKFGSLLLTEKLFLQFKEPERKKLGS